MISKRLLGLISGFTIIAVFSAGINVYATDKTAEIRETQDWNVPGEYPVTTESTEWASMSYVQCLEACEMPEELLYESSTEVLAKYVLEYPFLGDILIFDTAEEAIMHLSNTSNICREFFSRDDAEEILLKEYDLLSVDYNDLFDSESNNPMVESGYAKELFLQTFFSYSLEDLSEQNTETLKQILSDKYEAKKGICDDFSTGMLFYELVQKDLEYVPEEVVAEEMYEVFNSDASVYAGATGFVSSGKYYAAPNKATYLVGTYMKYDRAPVCFRYYSGEFSDTEVALADKNMYDSHRSWTKVRSASKKYNCHSYAWITTDESNRYWLGNPDYYANSKYFDCTGTNCSANAGDKIIIRDYDTADDGYSGSTDASHSLIATSYGAGVTSIQTESKLGNYGVYRAALFDMMIFYSGASYDVYQNV